MPKSDLQSARSSIVQYFSERTRTVLRRTDISSILEEKRRVWKLSESTTTEALIAFLAAHAKYKQIKVAFPKHTATRYVRQGASAYSLAMSVRPRGHLTHNGAMGLHGLTDRAPKTVYVNEEQSPKPSNGAPLEQRRIDAAFAKRPRTSKRVASLGDHRICLLNGMHTGGLGVMESETAGGEPVRVTDIERTLVDIAVRPFYAGGVPEVIGAYARARNALDVEKLATTLKRLDYAYPYHQAVGFYMERAGVYSEEEMESLRRFGLEFDFYLTHQMSQPEYSSRWRLFYPKGI